MVPLKSWTPQNSAVLKHRSPQKRYIHSEEKSFTTRLCGFYLFIFWGEFLYDHPGFLCSISSISLGGPREKTQRREVITFLQSPGYCKWSHSAARLLWPGNLGPKMLGNSEKIFPSVIMAMARKRSPFSSMIFPSPFSTLHLFELSHCYVWLPEVSRNNTGNKMVIWGCHRTWPYKYGEGYCCNSRTNASQRLGLDTNHLALHFYHVNQGFQSLFTTVSLLTHRSMIQTYNHGCLPYPDIPKGLASSVPVPTIMLV